MHTYLADDVKSCLGGRRLVFVGDSTTRQLFWAALRRLDMETYEREARTFAVAADRSVNLSFLVHHVQLDFVWDPWLNSTTLFGQLSRFRSHPGTADYEKLAKQESRDSPAVIILGTPGLSAARNADSRYLGAFSEGINTVMHYLRGDIESSVLLPTAKAQAAYSKLPNMVLLTPVQVPAYDKLSFSRSEKITPDKIKAMNWNLEHSDTLDQSHVTWSYNLMTEGTANAYDDDGFHVLDRVADWRLNIVLNARCNAGLARSGSPRNKITCCVPYSSPTRVQSLLLGLSLLSLPWLLLDRDQSAFETAGARRAAAMLIAMASTLVVAGYCFLSDRTHLFDKNAKHFDASNFAWSIFTLGILAACSIRTSRRGFLAPLQHNPVSFLGRGQTEEMKALNKGFGTVWDLERVHFHLSIDKFVPVFGILTAAVTHRFTVLQQRQAGEKAILLDAGSPFHKLNSAFDKELMDMIYSAEDATPIKALWIAFSTMYLIVFVILGFAAKSYSDNDAYDAYHSYISPWLVLAAVVVRNCRQELRRRQVTGAIALGRISLEVSVLQTHIWLAGDGTSILRIGSVGRHGAWASPLARPAELTVLSIVFLWAAVKCRSSAQKVAQWLRPEADDDQGPSMKDQRSSLEMATSSQGAVGRSGHDVDIEDAGAWADAQPTPNRESEWKTAGILALLWLGNMAYGDH
ncbi:hypothetical protein ACHAQH_002006 [Verticillium albo-atrum]